MKKIGLIAGSGELPVIFLKAARKKNIEVVVFEIIGEENRATTKYAFKKYPIKITALTDILRYSKKEKLKNMIMLGYVRHTNMLKNLKFPLKYFPFSSLSVAGNFKVITDPYGSGVQRIMSRCKRDKRL